MTSYTTANTISDLFRSLCALLDEVAYWLLGIMYEILFNVASTDIFTNDTIVRFYGRVQLIIGVFMVFKLAVSIIQGIINPDTFMDKKAGASSLIGRIVFALILLTVLTPINIPNATSSYDKNLKSNGLLFGTLYELQDRILANNTLGRLILGKDAETTASQNQSNKQNQSLIKKADNFSVTILKGFIHLNLKDGKDDETLSANRICDFTSTDELKAGKKVYDDAKKGKTTPKKMLSIINLDCKNPEGSGKRYAFVYIPLISTIMAGLFIYILLGEIITIAIRSLKLAVLRLLAPIPIISYIDPKSAKDGAFGSWVKALTSTYLELFIHLAVIYFIIFLIQDIIDNGINNVFGTGVVGFISGIFVFVGLFFFIKQAPKFIKDMLGIKGSSANVGLAGLLGGTAMALEGKDRSLKDRARSFGMGAILGTDTATQGYNQGKAVPLGAVWTSNQNKMAQMYTGDKDAQGGVKGHILDRMDWKTREAQASRLGYGMRDMAEAKYTKGKVEAEAFAASERLAIAEHKMNNLPASATQTQRDAAYNEWITAYRENNKAQADLQSAEKDYKKIDGARSTLRVGPRPIDSSTETYRSPRKVKTKAYTETDAQGVTTTYKRAVNPDGTWVTNEPAGHQYTADLDSYETLDDSTWASGPGGGPGPGHP